MKPLWWQEARWREQYRHAKEEHDIALLVYEAQKKAYTNNVQKVRPTTEIAVLSRPSANGTDNQTPVAEQSAALAHTQPLPPRKPTPPVSKRLVTNDATTEALAVIMNQNPRGILRYMDELTGFIKSMNAYRGGRGSDRQFYLSCWSGSPAQVDRKSQCDPILVREPFLGIVGGIQPEMLGTLEDDRGRNDGFIHRFLFAYPDPPGRRNWNEARGVSQEAREVWHRAVAWLLQLALKEPDSDEIDPNPQPRTLTFTDEAVQLWRDWNQKHWDETEWDCFPPPLRGVWSKFEVHALSLVLVAHMLRVACDHALTNRDYYQQDPPIDMDSMHRGLLLTDYFKHHVVRVFHQLKVNEADKKADQAITWVRKRPDKRATPRELQQHGVAGVKTRSEAEAMLKNLEDRGLGEMLTRTSTNRNKRTVDYFQAN
jgi:hypothetical protein